jgi:pimeloyl-ACP methyl ester carboxylesterase
VERSYPEGLKNFYSLLLTPNEQALFADDLRYKIMTDTSRAPSKDAALATLACLMQEDMRDVLPRITAPALILHGDEDSICNPAGAAFMHSAISGSKLVMLEHTGHAPFLTRSDEVTGLLRLFLESAP